MSGPFLLGATNASGRTSFDFTYAGLTTGDEVRLAIVGIMRPLSAGSPPLLDGISLLEWDLPTTPGAPTPTVPDGKDLRGVTVPF
jgi:hypothetical protein